MCFSWAGAPDRARMGVVRGGVFSIGVAWACVLPGAVVALPGAHADPLPVPGTGVLAKDAQPAPAWATGARSVVVSFPSRRSHAVLAGTLYGPPNLETLDKLPAVV